MAGRCSALAGSPCHACFGGCPVHVTTCAGCAACEHLQSSRPLYVTGSVGKPCFLVTREYGRALPLVWSSLKRRTSTWPAVPQSRRERTSTTRVTAASSTANRFGASDPPLLAPTVGLSNQSRVNTQRVNPQQSKKLVESVEPSMAKPLSEAITDKRFNRQFNRRFD